jgi:iron-sulfur cluster repair protein YtfE (RIC family)
MSTLSNYLNDVKQEHKALLTLGETSLKLIHNNDYRTFISVCRENHATYAETLTQHFFREETYLFPALIQGKHASLETTEAVLDLQKEHGIITENFRIISWLIHSPHFSAEDAATQHFIDMAVLEMTELISEHEKKEMKILTLL